MTARSHRWPFEPERPKPGYWANHYRADGTEKRGYRDADSALEMARRYGFEGHNAYRCATCGHWHLGHRSEVA